MNALLLREDRLVVWDRLIRGEHVSVEECHEFIGRLAPDACSEEKSACMLLLASVRVANERSDAVCRNLRAALRYWFSHSGSKDRPEPFDPRTLDRTGLESVLGLYLSWPEAMKSVGRTTVDYTALNRITELLRARCAEEWKQRLGSSPPNEISHRR